MKPTIFFIGDNRNSGNWGRGASIALRQMLSSKFDIIDSIAGESFDLSTTDAGYVGTLLPQRYYHHFRFLLERRARAPIGWYLKMEELWGARDFIAEDPSVSVDNLTAHRHRNPELGRIFNAALKADVLVIDGDGDIIFTTPPRRSAPVPRDRQPAGTAASSRFSMGSMGHLPPSDATVGCRKIVQRRGSRDGIGRDGKISCRASSRGLAGAAEHEGEDSSDHVLKDAGHAPRSERRYSPWQISGANADRGRASPQDRS